MTAAAVRSASIPTFHRTTEVEGIKIFYREGRRPPASDLAGVPRLPRWRIWLIARFLIDNARWIDEIESARMILQKR